MTGLALTHSTLFDGLDPEGLADFERHMAHRTYLAGEAVCRAGDESSSLYVIKRGLLHAIAAASNTVVARHRSGDVVGEVALLTGGVRSATLVARVPTDVGELSREDFLAVAERHPVLLANLGRILCRRLVSLGQRIASDAAGSARGRRAEAVAVLVDRRRGPRAERIVEATTNASPSPVVSIDLTRPGAPEMSTALGQLEESLVGETRVIVVVDRSHSELALLSDHCDRVVALLGQEQAAALARVLHLKAEQIEQLDPSAIDIGWLGRHLARTKLGLALGAGGAKGFAHVGAIAVLERAGYRFDQLAGSSIGAWVGAWLALGMRAREIEQTLRGRFTDEAVQALFRRGATGDPSGLVVMDRLARETTGEATLDDLETPLVVMTADLEGRRPVALAAGPLHAALVAAMTVPGLYAPLRRDHQRLVDAVVLTPVPTEALIVSGADVTIAINLLGRTILPAWPGEGRPEQVHRTDRDALVESLELAQVDASARQTALADIPVTPIFGPGTWRHFHLADRYLQAGATAMEAALPALAELARPSEAMG